MTDEQTSVKESEKRAKLIFQGNEIEIDNAEEAEAWLQQIFMTRL